MIILKGWEINDGTATWRRSEVMWDRRRHTAVITVRYEAEPERMRERILREIENVNPMRERKELEKQPTEPGMYAALAVDGQTRVVTRLSDVESSWDIEAFAADNPAVEFAPEWIRQAMSSAQPAPGGDRQDDWERLFSESRDREHLAQDRMEEWPHAPSRGPAGEGLGKRRGRRR